MANFLKEVGRVLSDVVTLGGASHQREVQRQHRAREDQAIASLNAQNNAYLQSQQQQAKFMQDTQMELARRAEKANQSLEQTRLRQRRGRTMSGIFGGESVNGDNPFSSNLG